MITLSGVSYAYPDTENYVLADIDLTVRPGQIVGIVGASGSGKTTLAKAISGFIPHVEGGELSGTVEINGINLADISLAEAVAHVGLVIQSPFNQISGAKFSVREEIAFGLENRGVAREEMVERIAAVAELMRITHLLDRSPYDLSGGQMQLVAIASMIVMRTSVLVMDEPTSQLDPGGTRMVFDVISQLAGTGVTIVILEHKLELLREHTDQIHVLVNKRIVASGDPQSILSDVRMTEWGIGSTRYSQAARQARQAGLFSEHAPIPVSFDDAVSAFEVRSDAADRQRGI